MPLLQRLLLACYRHVAALSWPALASLVVLHMSVAWLGFAAAGESKAARLDTFWYFYAVTATTTGYGDIAPESFAGRLVTVLWVMPGGIALFTAIVTKLVQSVGRIWTGRMRGDGDYSAMSEHLVLVGWHPARTPRLVRLLLADHRYDHAGMVLVAAGLDENPLPDHLRYVRVASLSSPEAMVRSGAAGAAAVVAMGENDNETLAIGLAVGTLPQPPRIVAHFQDESVAMLLRAHCASAECSVSLSVEMLARSAQDPGSSEVQRQIISPIDSPTQFRMVVPGDSPDFTYGQGLVFLKRAHDATLIALHRAGREIEVNARSDEAVGSGDGLFYVAAQRLMGDEIDWRACAAVA